jgi:hypothetical protein
MPGLDAIPYAAWRLVGPSALDVLAVVVHCMHSGDVAAQDSEAFALNHGLFCCLPKTPSGCDEAHGEFFAAKDMRPLTVVNSDNRLVAAACRLAWEPLAPFVHEHQRGFVGGRSMTQNILDLEVGSRLAAVSSDTSATILWDLAATFPSVSRSFLLEQLYVRFALCIAILPVSSPSGASATRDLLRQRVYAKAVRLALFLGGYFGPG